MIKKISLSLIVVILFFVIAEAATRLLLPDFIPDYNWRISNHGYGDFQPNIDFVETHKAGGIPFRLITNRQGLRRQADIDVSKPENTIRILAVGDSFTFGFGVNNSDTWTYLLEQQLNSTSSSPVEVLNAGFPGYTIKDEFEYLQQKGLLLKPDLVILAAFENDLADFSPPARQEFGRQQKLAANRRLGFLTLLERSHFISRLAYYLYQFRQVATSQKLKQAQLEPDQADYQSQYLHYLQLSVELLKTYHIPLLVVVFPDSTTAFTKTSSPLEVLLKRQQPKLGYYLTIIRPVFQAQTTRQAAYLIPKDFHLSRYGNSIVADKLVSPVKSILSL